MLFPRSAKGYKDWADALIFLMKEILDAGLCKRSRKQVVVTYPFEGAGDTGKVWEEKDHPFEGLLEKAGQRSVKYWQMNP